MSALHRHPDERRASPAQLVCSFFKEGIEVVISSRNRTFERLLGTENGHRMPKEKGGIYRMLCEDCPLIYVHASYVKIYLKEADLVKQGRENIHQSCSCKALLTIVGFL